MRNFLRKPQAGSIKRRRKIGLIKNSQDIYLSRLRRHATWRVITAHEKKSINTWTSTSSAPSLTKQHIMDLAHSVSTSSVNLYSILISGKLSNTSRRRIASILSSLRQTVHYLNDLLINYSAQELIKSSGLGDLKPNSVQNLKKG